MPLSSLFFAPWVVAARMPHIAFEAMTPGKHNPESDRMVQEKLDAVVSGALAAQRSLISSSFDMLSAGLKGDAVAAGVAMLKAGPLAAQASLVPAARTVKANMKRLSRT